MIRKSVLYLVVFITCLAGCTKDNEKFSSYYLYATVDGKKFNADATLAMFQRLKYNIFDDTLYYLNIYGLNADTAKIISISLQVTKPDTGEYIFNSFNDSIKFVEAAYKPDSVYFSTRFNLASINSGRLHITAWKKSYVKGTFEFTATSPDQNDQFVMIENGSFYSELK
jgi:hypothetical protein